MPSAQSSTIWQCKIGVLGNLRHLLPEGADEPMREAIGRRFERVLGMPAEFTFSGWGGGLSEGELAVVEDRLPDRAKVTREIPYDVTDAMVDVAFEKLYGHRNRVNRQEARRHIRELLDAVLDAAASDQEGQDG